MKIWYDILQVKKPEEVPEVVHLFGEIVQHILTTDSVITQIKDVTIRTKYRARKEFEIRFLNKRKMKFNAFYTKGVWLIDEDEEMLRDHAMMLHK